MKATTLIVALGVTGFLLENFGYATIGGAILKAVLPATLYSGGGALWTAFIVVSTSVLSFGAILLGSRLPYAVFLTFFLGLMSFPISVLTDSTIGMPNPIRVLFGLVYLSMFISGAIAVYRSDA